MIFVFGSNLAGRHGKGAALIAVQNYGAVRGKGLGKYGRSFAIPTKDYKLKSLPLFKIKEYIDFFIKYAEEHPEFQFQVTRIGCGLAGYQDKDIAPLFENAPSNCQFDVIWSRYLPQRRYWGSF